MKEVDPAKYYDDMDAAYIRKTENDLHNAYYERPAIKALITEIEGKQVLEAGCGGGVLTEWLVDQGATVTAFDISEKMINHAKQRLGDKAEVLVADLTQPLSFVKDNSVDMIVASLVLHYISNWLPMFEEFKRVLKKDGVIVFSTHHPHADWKWHNRPNYFLKEQYEDTWTISGKPYKVRYYHRTLANMFAIFGKFGFYVDVLLEPLPVKEGKEVDPKSYEYLLKNPQFLFIRLKKK